MNKKMHKTINVLAKVFAVFLTVSIVVGILNAVFDIDGISKKIDKGSASYTESGEIDFDGAGLLINTKAVNINITTGDKFSYTTDNKFISVSEDDDKITIIEDEHHIKENELTSLDIVLPKDTVFPSVKLDLGAGEMTIESLAAEKLEFDCGAFEVEIGNLIVTEKAKIDTGVGNVTIKDGEINNLDLDLGMGNVELSAKLTGKAKFDCGVGNLNVNAKGARDDYSVSVNKGLGKVTIDGKFVGDGDVIGSGDSRINLNGGVGDISLDFTDNQISA